MKSVIKNITLAIAGVASLGATCGIVGAAANDNLYEVKAASLNYEEDFNVAAGNLTLTSNAQESGNSFIFPVDPSSYGYICFKDVFRGRQPTSNVDFVITSKLYQSNSWAVSKYAFSFFWDSAYGWESQMSALFPSDVVFPTSTSTETNTSMYISSSTISSAYESGIGNDLYMRFGRSANYSTMLISNIKVSYTYEGSGPTPGKTLESIAVSGSPTKKAYEEGDSFDTTGLVVTGTYDDASTEIFTSGITWSINPSDLTVGLTSLQVQATYDSIASAWYTVSGLTVSERVTTADDNYALNVKDSFATESADLVTWEAGHTHLSLAKGTCGMNANYSIPKTGGYASSTSFIGGHILNFSPYGDNRIAKAAINPFYSTTVIANGTLTNCSLEFDSSATSYILTPTDGTQLFSLKASGGNYDQTNIKTIVISYVEGEATRFESIYIKKSAYPTSGAGTDTGACRGEEGYYAKAKAAYGQLSETAKNSFLTNADFANARARLSAWAVANGEIFDTTNGSFSAAQVGNFLIGNEDSTLAVALIGGISALTIAGVVTIFLKKKKAQ